ncbi:MAG: hypothetical protein COA63_001455 [Methylophaga sp.]|nr:hypothetical protein [Methylophaga sp.]
MLDLVHYSTFSNKEKFLDKIDISNHLAIYRRSTNTEIDDRTKWVRQVLSNTAKSVWDIDYDVREQSLKINDKSISIRDFVQGTKKKPAITDRPLIDATSLNFPELQYLFYWFNKIEQPFDLIYVEPECYPPSSPDKFNLSEDGLGLAQLPPFLGRVQNNLVYVISIGFEGHRIQGLLNNDEYSNPGFQDIKVIIGVPAFKAGFDRDSLKANALALAQIKKMPSREVHIASANNPCVIIKYLNKVSKSLDRRDESRQKLSLIPFGTKPTAIGMAWFAVKNQKDTIVTYDHVKKVPGRSKGIGKVHFAQFDNID